MTIYRAPDLDTFAWQQPVKDKDLTAPPGSPAKGDRYIVGASATGAWAGHDNQITYYNGYAWVFLTLAEGQMCWVEDENKVYKYDGSEWAVLVPEASGGLGYSLQGAGANIGSVGDNAIYYFGGQPALAPSNISAYHRFYVPKAGTIKAAYVYASVGGLATPEMGEYVTAYICKGIAATEISQGEFTEPSVVFSNTSLNISVSAGDYLLFKIVCPTFSTNPANLKLSGVVYIE